MKLCQYCFQDIFSYACVAYETIKIKPYKCEERFLLQVSKRLQTPTLYEASTGLPCSLYTNPLARALSIEPRWPASRALAAEPRPPATG
jgi:hypothetical protein